MLIHPHLPMCKCPPTGSFMSSSIGHKISFVYKAPILQSQSACSHTTARIQAFQGPAREDMAISPQAVFGPVQRCGKYVHCEYKFKTSYAEYCIDR